MATSAIVTSHRMNIYIDLWYDPPASNYGEERRSRDHRLSVVWPAVAIFVRCVDRRKNDFDVVVHKIATRQPQVYCYCCSWRLEVRSVSVKLGWIWVRVVSSRPRWLLSWLLSRGLAAVKCQQNFKQMKMTCMQIMQCCWWWAHNDVYYVLILLGFL